jgi:hypothetical protein
LNVVIEMDESTGGRPQSAFVTERVHLGWNLRGAISSHVELSDCRFAFKQLPGREREPLGSPLVSISRGMVFTARAIDRVERPSAANKMIRERKTSRCSVVGGSHPRLKRRTILRRQPDFRSLGIIPMLNHESAFGETGY